MLGIDLLDLIGELACGAWCNYTVPLLVRIGVSKPSQMKVTSRPAYKQL